MQSWSKERRGEKQNQEMQTFQIKTRQYNNLTMLGPNANINEDSSYSPKQTPKIENTTNNSFNFSNFMNKAQKASFKQRYNLEDDQQNLTPFSPYNPKVNQQRNDIGKISRNKNLQLDYRKYLKDTTTVSKSPIKKDYFEKSYVQNLNMMDSSQTQSFKRENAKKKGIQMKMTNIDSINGKISSLLNMVNKNKRVNENSGSKSKTRYDSKEAYDFRENSFQKYRPKIHVTPSPPKNTSIQANKKYINKQQRNKVYSELDHQFREGFDSIKYQNKKQRYIACNEEDSRRVEQLRNNKNYKYSPRQQYDHQKYLQNKSFERSALPYQRPQTKSAYSKKQPYPERQYEKTASPSRQYNKKTEQTIYDRTPKRKAQKTQYSGYKYFNKPRSDQVFEQKLPQYVPKYKKLRQKLQKGQNQMLPLSIEAAKYADKANKNQRPTFAFEEHMQNIRGKIVESEQKTLKYQQRLRQQDNGINNEYKPTGRLYKKNTAQFHNGFDLKIYPVQVDKPNTLKIAEKLADQIQIDKKLSLPRMLLQQQEDQYKWSQIELSLKSKQFKMTKFQIQQLLELSPEQKDSNNHHRGYQNQKNIGDLLFQAQRHWEKQVYGCASQKGLKMQNFNAETIDSRRNGVVSAEDLAHFINTYTGRKYRSKDTILIYRRLQLLEGSKNNENVKFSTFVRALAI